MSSGADSNPSEPPTPTFDDALVRVLMQHIEQGNLKETQKAAAKVGVKCHLAESLDTPLHLACLFGHRDIVEWLLKLKANPNAGANRCCAFSVSLGDSLCCVCCGARLSAALSNLFLCAPRNATERAAERDWARRLALVATAAASFVVRSVPCVGAERGRARSE